MCTLSALFCEALAAHEKGIIHRAAYADGNLKAEATMQFFQNSKGQRVAIEFETKRIDGYIASIEDGCIKLTSAPEGKGTVKYIAWPNANILYVEFLASDQNRGKVGF